MNKTAEEQIAEVLGALTPVELRQFIDTPYGFAESKMAMTVGFCNKLAEFGLTPSDMNAAMSKTADDGPIGTAGKMVGMGTLALAIAAAIGGNLTGKAHHSMERRLNKMDDKENVRLREKADRLSMQRDELAEDLASRPITPMAGPSPARPKPKQDIVQLLD